MRLALQRYQKLAFCFFLGIIISIQNGQAQDHINKKIRWGIMLGPNYAQADLSKSKLPTGVEFEKSNIIGPSIGLRTLIPITNKVNLQTGINFHYLLFELRQTTFGTDTIEGVIYAKPHIKSWEIPVIVSYKPAFKNTLLKNFYVAGGVGLAMDHYNRLSSGASIFKVAPAPPGPGHSSQNFIPSDFYNGRSETGNVFAPSLIAGFGTDVNLFARRKLQLNFWYAQGLKQQDQLNTRTTFEVGYDYPWEINALMSSFRMEIVYFP